MVRRPQEVATRQENGWDPCGRLSTPDVIILKFELPHLKNVVEWDAQLLANSYARAVNCEASALVAPFLHGSVERLTPERKGYNMAESVYKVIALVGTSEESWEKAAAAAVERASQTLRNLRVARIVDQDVHIEPGKPLTYRVKMELSFKYEDGE